MDKKLIAISTNGSNNISLVKSVNEQEYKKLINDQAKRLAKGEKLALEHNEKHKQLEEGLSKAKKNELLLAKSVYDNFVDRGLIENNEDFQKESFDYYFNDKEISLDNVPQEYEKILKKVRDF